MIRLIGLFLAFLVVFSLCSSAQSLTWREVYRNNNFRFVSITCPDSDNCYAAGYNPEDGSPIILISKNRGNNWEIVLDKNDITENKPVINSLVSTDKEKCLAICRSGLLLKTTNGGDTWSQIKLPTDQDLNSIDMYGEMVGLVSDEFGLFKTTDGGDNWQAVNNIPFQFNRISNIAMLTGSIYLVTASISEDNSMFDIFRSEDSGNNWNRYDFIDNMHGGWTFIDSLTGWASGDEIIDDGQQTMIIDKVATTKDGGKTWTLQLNDGSCPPNLGLQSIDFLDKDNGIAAGGFGKVIRTTDGGETWGCENTLNVITDYPPDMDISFADSSSVLVSTYTGSIVKADLKTDINEGDNIAEENISISPNPADGYINVGYYLKEPGAQKISLINSVGIATPMYDKMVFENGWNNIHLSLEESIIPGLYFIRIQSGNETIIKKLIIY